ncbi:hypothetical protein [Actinokineospora xionganensis]|nr:hypothetical protein [Actinokineospora xionganensis]
MTVPALLQVTVDTTDTLSLVFHVCNVTRPAVSLPIAARELPLE